MLIVVGKLVILCPQVCSLCRMNGATLGCFVKGCSLCYHYLCAADAGKKMLNPLVITFLFRQLQQCASLPHSQMLTCLLYLMKYNLFSFHNSSFTLSVFTRATLCQRGSLRQRCVRLSVCHTPVLCLVERKQDREVYTV